MSGDAFLWITEDEVASVMDLAGAITTLEAGLRLQAHGEASNMSKTQLLWGEGHTLHAIGAVLEGAGVAGAKTWAHTKGGVTPLLILWDAEGGALLAVIEAFALGQMRTGAMSGVATRYMSAPDAECLALFGTGKQALSQLAAVAAVRRLRLVRVWGRDRAKRDRFVDVATALGYDFTLECPDTPQQTADGATIVTLATRAREPFFDSDMASRGAHINAIGAIAPDREEFTQDLFSRADLLAADDPVTAKRLSREFDRYFRSCNSDLKELRPICELVAAGEERPAHFDLSIFKAMGMGISDLAVGVEVYRRAVAGDHGRRVDQPQRTAPYLGASPLEKA